MRRYDSYEKSPLKMYDRGWQRALYVMMAAGLAALTVPLVRSFSPTSDIDVVWLSACIMIMVAGFIAFAILGLSAVNMRKKLKDPTYSKITQIEMLTSRYTQKNKNEAIEYFFDSAFNISKRERVNQKIVKNYVAYSDVLDIFLENLQERGVALDSKEAIRVISAVLSGKFVVLNTDDIELGGIIIDQLASIGIKSKQFDMDIVFNTESLVRALDKDLGLEELRLIELVNLDPEKQDILATALPLLNVRYSDVELEYKNKNLRIPSHVVFCAIETFDEIKWYPKELRKAATIIEIHPRPTNERVESVGSCDVTYDYLYRIDSQKGSFMMSEDDWKFIDSIMAIQKEVKLSNKECVEIERFVSLLGQFGIQEKEFRNTILIERILPLVAPIISSANDKEMTKKISHLIGTKNEELSRVLMDYMYEENANASSSNNDQDEEYYSNRFAKKHEDEIDYEDDEAQLASDDDLIRASKYEDDDEIEDIEDFLEDIDA